MPFRMDYTDPSTGANYPESWWELAQVNINFTGRTSMTIWHGWADKHAFDDGMLPIHAEILNMNNPDDFEQYIRPIAEQVSGQSLDYNLRQVVLILFTFFSTGTEFSSVAPVASRIHSSNNKRVVVQFTQEVVNVGGALKDGVTVKVNGVSRTVTVATADLSGFFPELWFDLTSPVFPGDVVTWEYDETPGTWADGQFLPMASRPATAVENLLTGVVGAFAVHGHSLVAASARTTFGVVALVPGRSGVVAASRMTFAAVAAIPGHSLVTAIGTKTP